MTQKQGFILSEIIVYIVAHALNFVYIITIVGIAPQKKTLWKTAHYSAGWVLLAVYIAIFAVLFFNFTLSPKIMASRKMLVVNT